MLDVHDAAEYWYLLLIVTIIIQLVLVVVTRYRALSDPANSSRDSNTGQT